MKIHVSLLMRIYEKNADVRKDKKKSKIDTPHAISVMMKETKPARFQVSCTAKKSSTLLNFPLFQAHSLPFAPHTNTQIKLKNGIRQRSGK